MQELFITFMRHGRSRADDENVHEGRYDSPLTVVGEQQVQTRARGWLECGVTFDHIVCSPLLRARRTAEIIAAALQLPLKNDPDWMEMDNGLLAGLSHEVALQRFPVPDFRNPYEAMAEAGESEWQLYNRATQALECVIRQGIASTLVVSHGAVLNAAFRGIVGAQPPVNNAGVFFALGDTGYLRCRYRPAKHQWLIMELNPGIKCP
jgi:2,3-bisphosphoglycerate-dependent phosphoglycerate mutase